MSRSKLAPEDNEALRMIRAAGITPTVENVTVLGNDIRAVADDGEEYGNSWLDDGEDMQRAARTLLTRVGGSKNLASYLDCIIAADRIARKDIMSQHYSNPKRESDS